MLLLVMVGEFRIKMAHMAHMGLFYTKQKVFIIIIIIIIVLSNLLLSFSHTIFIKPREERNPKLLFFFKFGHLVWKEE